VTQLVANVFSVHRKIEKIKSKEESQVIKSNSEFVDHEELESVT